MTEILEECKKAGMEQEEILSMTEELLSDIE